MTKPERDLRFPQRGCCPDSKGISSLGITILPATELKDIMFSAQERILTLTGACGVKLTLCSYRQLGLGYTLTVLESWKQVPLPLPQGSGGLLVATNDETGMSRIEERTKTEPPF